MSKLVDDNKFDSILKNSFQNAEMDVPDKGWEKLQFKLRGRIRLSYRRIFSKNFLTIKNLFIISGAAASGSVILISVYTVIKNPDIKFSSIFHSDKNTVSYQKQAHDTDTAKTDESQQTEAISGNKTEKLYVVNTKQSPQEAYPEKENNTTFQGNRKNPLTENTFLKKENDTEPITAAATAPAAASTAAITAADNYFIKEDNGKKEEPFQNNIHPEPGIIPAGDDVQNESSGIAQNENNLNDFSNTASLPLESSTVKDSAIELTKNNDSITKSDTTAPVDSITNSKRKKWRGNEFHFGVHYTINSASILNQNTYGQFQGKELAYRPDYGAAYGLMLGYDIRRRHGFQAGFIFNSTQGQKNHDVLSIGEYIREIDLEYIHIPVVYKFKCYLNSKSFTAMLNIIAGFQYGKLNHAIETLNGNTTNITERFRKNEISFIFNIESDIYLNKYLYFTIGANSCISNDINTKDWPVQHSGYSKSHNLLYGANFGLSYYIQN